MKIKNRKQIAFEKIEIQQIRIARVSSELAEGIRSHEDAEHEISKAAWGIDQELAKIAEYDARVAEMAQFNN